MRHSILGITVQQAQLVGAANIKQTRVGRIIFADLTKEQVAQLRSKGASVEPVHKVKSDIIRSPIAPPEPVAGEAIYTPEVLVWAAGFEDARQITTPPLYGEAMTLAIVGTGIRETHEKVLGRVVYSKNFTSAPMEDKFDHDTGVCGIVLAVVPMCSILNLKVLDDLGEGTEEEVVMAVDECIALFDEGSPYAPQVINMSLGSIDDGNPYSPLRVICREATERNMWCSAAAGNEGPGSGTVTSPACDPTVFATGSCKYEPFTISEFSSRGPTIEGIIKPDAVFFGENIQMASSRSDTALAAKSGTSFSTPFNSGIAILFKEGEIKVPHYQPITGILPYPERAPILTMPGLLEQWLGGLCIKPQGVLAGKDNNYGEGLPFGDLFAQAFKPSLDISVIVLPLMMVAMMGIVVKEI